MPTTIELPHVGESVTEGIIGRWLVQPGDRVEKYDPLVEVMTDKVNMEVPSPFSGTLIRTLVQEGDTAAMGAPIAEMEVEGEPAQGSALDPLAGSRGVSPGPARSSPRRDAEEEHAQAPGGQFEFMESVRSVGPTGSGEGGWGRAEAARVEGRAGAKQPLSPLVRRLVQQHNVDVALVTGTGLGGRITREDVLRHVEAREAQPPPVGQDEEEVPLTPLRKAIAEHMVRSVREIPAAWSLVEVDVTGLVQCRDAHREAFQRQGGAPLSYLAFVVQAVAEALREHPRLNSRWGGTPRAGLYVRRRINIGIAVATDEGLMVPVIHDADRLGVSALALRIHELTELARRQALRLEDVQGGTFTINNTGALGSVVSYPIINHPQAAILTTEAIVKRPVVLSDETGADTIAVRSMMNVGLAFDHRVCDGAEAGGFLNAVKSRLEAITQETAIT